MRGLKNFGVITTSPDIHSKSTSIEKIYQTLKTVLHQLDVHKKISCSALRVVFSTLFLVLENVVFRV